MAIIPAHKVVLVVEDKSLIRTFMSDVLEDEGYQVVEAINADKALILLQARPDVVVLVTDVEMPSGSMNGYELARTVNESSPTIGIIVMSGRASPRLNDMPAGAVFLSKPVSSAHLATQVNEACVQAEGKRGILAM